MGMTIDEAIDFLVESKYSPYETPSSCTIDIAIDIMRKYQKIEQIYQKWNEVNDFAYNQAMREIGEVVEDGDNT